MLRSTPASSVIPLTSSLIGLVCAPAATGIPPVVLVVVFSPAPTLPRSGKHSMVLGSSPGTRRSLDGVDESTDDDDEEDVGDRGLSHSKKRTLSMA